MKNNSFLGYVLVMSYIIFTMMASADPFSEEDAFGSNAVVSINLADVDGDGDLDSALASQIGTYNSLYINDGYGHFTLREEQFVIPESASSIAIGFADVDMDCDLDAGVIDRNENGNRLYFNDGNGYFSYVDCFGIGDSECIAYADVDLDGDIDAAVCNNSSVPSMLYRNDGNGNFTGEEAFNIEGDDENIGCWGDFDDDGDPDLVVGGGTVRIYWNDGSGNFSCETISSGEIKPTESFAVGDVDKDGDLDICEVNIIMGTHQNRLFRNDGNGNFSQEDEFGDDEWSYTIGLGDLDNDGDLDGVVGEREGNPTHLYRNDGAGNFTEEEEFGLDVFSVALGDVDGDGDIDVATGTHTDNPQNKLFRNEQNDDNWIIIKTLGKFYELGSGYSNRDGIGAKIYIFEEGHIGNMNYLLGFQEVSAESGHLGQDAMELHFGIPEGDAVDIRIIWPGSNGSHITDEFTSVLKGDNYLCVEDEDIYDTAIELLEFYAFSKGNNIALKWSCEATEGETIEGFNLYRKEMELTYETTLTGSEDTHPHLDTNLYEDWTQINSSLITGQNPYSYIDDTVESGTTYEYELEAVVEEEPEILGKTTGTCGLPASFEITSIHPNPATDEVNITLSTPENAYVKIDVYDITGRVVKTLILGEVETGEHTEVLSTSELSSGVYTIKAKTEVEQSTKRMVVVR